MNTEQLKLELKEFVDNLTLERAKSKEGSDISFYNVDDKPPFNDFNKDVHHPGPIEYEKNDKEEDKALKDFVGKNGILGIRADDNFWIVAYLPYKYKELTIQDIVLILWPDKANDCTYHGDADDNAYWTAFFKPYEDAMKERIEHKKERKKKAELNDK